MIRATIDVNVLLSAIFSRHGFPHQVVLAFAVGIFVPIVSDRMVLELRRKLQDARIVRRFQITADDRSWIAGLLTAYATLIPVADSDVSVVSGDPEDDGVLAAAVLGRSDFLVTGDKGLLALGTHQGVKIVSPRDFMTLLRAAEADDEN